MTVLDYFVLLVVTVSVASGVIKGIIRAIVSVAFSVAGLIIAAHSYEYAAVLLSPVVVSWLANLLGFLLVFLVVFVGGGLLTWLLRGTLKRARLGWIDHTLGAVFGFVRGWLICSVVYLGLTAFPAKPEAVENAVFAPILLEGTRAIAYLSSSELRKAFAEGYEAVRRLWEQKDKNRTIHPHVRRTDDEEQARGPCDGNGGARSTV